MSALQDALHTAHPDQYNFILLQEPYTDKKGVTRANNRWTTVYPTNHKPNIKKSRAITLVNSQIDTDNWTQLDINSQDVIGIKVKNDKRHTTIFNIYNDCKNNDSIKTLATEARKWQESKGPEDDMIWAGDFNRHHPMWDAEDNNHLFTATALGEAAKLIDLLSIHSMIMILPPNTPTLESTATKNLTRVDNVFISSSAADKLIQCEVLREKRPSCTDHFPIVTKLDAQIGTASTTKRRNFRATDWDEFGETLKEKLKGIARPQEFRDGQRERAVRAREELEREWYQKQSKATSR